MNASTRFTDGFEFGFGRGDRHQHPEASRQRSYGIKRTDDNQIHHLWEWTGAPVEVGRGSYRRDSNMEELTIRTATEKDVAALLDIYRPYVERTAITFEYEVPTLEEFRQRICHTLGKISVSGGRGSWRDRGIRPI